MIKPKRGVPAGTEAVEDVEMAAQQSLSCCFFCFSLRFWDLKVHSTDFTHRDQFIRRRQCFWAVKTVVSLYDGSGGSLQK